MKRLTQLLIVWLAFAGAVYSQSITYWSGTATSTNIGGTNVFLISLMNQYTPLTNSSCATGTSDVYTNGMRLNFDPTHPLGCELASTWSTYLTQTRQGVVDWASIEHNLDGTHKAFLFANEVVFVFSIETPQTNVTILSTPSSFFNISSKPTLASNTWTSFRTDAMVHLHVNGASSASVYSLNTIVGTTTNISQVITQAISGVTYDAYLPFSVITAGGSTNTTMFDVRGSGPISASAQLLWFRIYGIR